MSCSARRAAGCTLKMAFADRRTLLVGSMNFDARSALARGGDARVLDDEPEHDWLVRLKLRLLSFFVPEDWL